MGTGGPPKVWVELAAILGCRSSTLSWGSRGGVGRGKGRGCGPSPRPLPRYLAGVDGLALHAGAKHVGSDALGVGAAAGGGGDDGDVGADQVTGEGHCGGGAEGVGDTPGGLLGCSGRYYRVTPRLHGGYSCVRGYGKVRHWLCRGYTLGTGYS